MMDEYMTHVMFQEDDESVGVTSYSSTLSASIGISFFKVVPIQSQLLDTRTGRPSKALSDEPVKSYEGFEIITNSDKGDKLHMSEPFLDEAGNITDKSRNSTFRDASGTPQFSFYKLPRTVASEEGKDNYAELTKS